MRHHRPSDPLPPFGGGHMHMPTMSAFSPVALRGSPMPPMSPSLSASHMHSRPSSVGPSSSYRHQSPGIQRSLAMSPPRGTPISVNTRQRKPSAPPIPVPAAYAGRASISGYPHHQYAEQRVTQLPPPSARRLPYPMGSSPQMSATRPGVAPPYPPSVESSFGPRYADPHHYQPQQQQRYNTPPLASAHPPPPPQPTYHYPQPSPMSPVNMHLPPPPPPGMRQYPLPGTGAVPNGSSRGYSAGPPPSQQQPPPPYHHHGPPQH
ncbi:hypothetical protein H4S03_008772 [Coemansia sp. S3946]|nr:hypothetical protein H4S03_008772 [Coemansia sp. S3946]